MTKKIEDWLVDTLMSWAETFVDTNQEPYGVGDGSFDMLCDLAYRLMNTYFNTLCDKERGDVLFHLYQKFSGHNEELDDIVMRWQLGGEVSKEEFEEEIVKIYNLAKDL